MAVHNMHVGTVLYFAAAFAIGLTLVIFAAILNGQISSGCNNTVKHSISGIFGLGITLVIISILMFLIDHYCACSSAIGLLGSNISNVGFFAVLTMIISISSITLGAIIEGNIDEKCGKNVNKNLAKYIWIGGVTGLVLSIVVLVAEKTRKFVGSSQRDGSEQEAIIRQHDQRKGPFGGGGGLFPGLFGGRQQDKNQGTQVPMIANPRHSSFSSKSSAM